MDERNVVREIDVMTGEPMGLESGSVALASVNLSNDAGEALFVINLCAAMTPINLEAQQLPGLDQYKLYQVSRMEDGRRRYRLRLGFFTTESQAEDVLATVRSRYATAFTSCLCEEDVKFASGYLKRTVQDIQRTGRFAVTKIRRDSGATTTSIPALDTMTLRTLTAAEATGVHVALPEVEKAVVSSNTVDRAPPPTAKLPPKAGPRQAAQIATPKVVAQPQLPQSQKSAAAIAPSAAKLQSLGQTADSTSSTQRIKAIDTSKPMTIADAIAAMGQIAPPKRESLMRQAHAMASHDAAERAKAVPNNGTPFESADIVSLDATSQFKAPTFAVADPAKIISKQELKPVVTSAPVVPSAPKATATKPVQAKPVSQPTPQKTVPQQKAVLQQASSDIVTPQAKTPIVAKPQPAPQKPIATADWEVSVPPVHASKPSVRNGNGAYHVGAGVQIPNVDLTLENTTHVATSTKQEPATPTKVASPIDQANTNDLLLARELAKQSAMWRQENNSDVPSLDTTQTIRTLTKTELEDANRDKWFTVQLAISDQPANLDTMPHLDIFEAYTLYSVATMDSGRIRHALRLGFFREEVSAEAVMGYLRTFFGEPVITRIPDAEHARFANAPKRTAPVKAASTVVTLEEKRPTPIAVPTINTAVDRSSTKQANTAKPAARQAGVATRSTAVENKKPAARNGKVSASSSQQDMLEEARMLGLSDTQMIRVQKNPSLLARLVGKLGK